MSKPLTLFTFLLLTDQFLKFYFFYSKSSFNLNKGVSFGLNVPAVKVFSLLFLIFLFTLIFKTKNRKDRFFLSLIFVGGLSNLLDRFFYGGVLDYIMYLNLLKNNLADYYILIGYLGFIYNNTNGFFKRLFLRLE